METIVIPVGGMSCGGCVASVTKVLQALPGVQKAEVDLDKAQATVAYDPARLGRPQIAEAIESAGYEAG